MRSRLIGLMASVVSVYGCGSSTAPRNGPPRGPVSFIGVNQTDTVGTTLTQALVVTVVGPAGQSSQGHVVQFISMLDSAGNAYEAYVEALTSPQPLTFLAESLDASGRASADIMLGFKSGTARVLVKVPDFGYTDTAGFTVQAGNTNGIAITPLDTSVISGGAVTLHATTIDHYSNPTSQPVQLSVTGPATIAGQTVTSTAIGQITVVATSGKLVADTAHIVSLPQGTLAASTGNGIVVINFDGSGTSRIPLSVAVGNLKWAPSGTSLVFDQSASGCDGESNRLYTTDLQGHLSVVNSSGAYAQYPSYSRDGTWIYFTSNTGSSAVLWRVHPDGTGGDTLISQNPGFDLYPAPSPDGTQLVYASLTGASDLRTLSLSTGAVTDLRISGWAPSWSPTANQIAYLENYQCQSPIGIANADGTGVRQLTTDAYQGELDWSPDGQWIVGYNVSRNRIDVINATSGQTLPLPFTSNLSSPSWRPTPASMSRKHQ